MRYTVDYVEHSSAWLEVDIPDNADPEQWMREHWELVREQLEKTVRNWKSLRSEPSRNKKTVQQ